MKVEDIVQILNNRLREFKLSRSYATMSGDLERVNTADKEIIDLEDTLFKLNLLVDTTKSAAVTETVLTEVITDGSVAVLGDYDITPYATDPLHEQKVMTILSKMGVMDTVEKIDEYIKGKYPSSPVTGEMVMSASEAYIVDARLMMAIMEQDSSMGTAGLAVRTLNPGNVGNDDAGNTRTYESWQEGVTAVARWLNKHRVSSSTTEIPDTSTSFVTTSTPPIITPATTTTTFFTTSTPETAPVTTSTTTTTAAITTPATTTTPPTNTTTPVTPVATTPVTTSTTTTTTAIVPPTATSTPTTATTSTPAFTTPTEETPVTTSTTTTTTAISTPSATSTPTPAPEETVPVTTSTTTTTTVVPTTTTPDPVAPDSAAPTPETTQETTSTTVTTTVTPVEDTSDEEAVPVTTATAVTPPAE